MENFELIVMKVKHSFEVFRGVAIILSIHPFYDQLQKLDESDGLYHCITRRVSQDLFMPHDVKRWL